MTCLRSLKLALHGKPNPLRPLCLCKLHNRNRYRLYSQPRQSSQARPSLMKQGKRLRMQRLLHR